MLEYKERYQYNKQEIEKNYLSSKLRERSGYSGIYSQRNHRVFFEQLSTLEQKKLIQDLKIAYSQIISHYFDDENKVNKLIDRFVEKAFFVNLPINKVVEIHIELIDDLSRKLKLEGLHSDFLKNYRLALIDTLAHLAEMYRSVIKESCLHN